MKFAALPIRTRRLVFAAAGTTALIVGYVSYQRIFEAPKNALRASITQVKNSVFELQDALDDEVEHREKLRDFGHSTLGSETDVVQHRLRTGLTRAAEQAGLSNVVVDAGDPQDVLNPAVSAKGVATATKRALRSKPDFELVRGSVQGTGSLEQATRAIATLQSQPWLHRIDAFSLRPVGKARDRFELRVEVATLFARDLAALDTTEPELVAANVDLESLARMVAARAVFSTPDIARPVVAAADATPTSNPGVAPAPIAFAPYEDWRLTGIMAGRAGTSAILLNQRSGQSITLEKGGVVLDAMFVDAGGDTAIFEIAGKRYEVDNGTSLAARRPGG